MTKEQIDFLITGMFLQACENREQELKYTSWKGRVFSARRWVYQYKTPLEWEITFAWTAALVHKQHLESTIDLASWTYTSEGVARQEAAKRFVGMVRAMSDLRAP